MFVRQINSIINEYIKLSPNSKVSIGVINKNDKIAYNFDFNGITNIEYEYQIGSVSKTFTAHLVMKYINLNVIDINENIGYYLDLESDEYPTIYELLTHTSGYTRFVIKKHVIQQFFIKRYEKNIYENIDNEYILRVLKKKKRSRKYNYAYSDFNYAVLALVLEKVCKRSYIELLNEFIKEDLKLNNTHLLNEYVPNTIGNKGKKICNNWIWKSNNPYIVAGGICSNLTDMMKYLELQIEAEKDYIKDCHQVNENTKKRKDKLLICLGWHANKNANHLWHLGGVGCYKTAVIVSKKRKIGVVVMTNCYDFNVPSHHHLAKMIYGLLSRNKKILE